MREIKFRAWDIRNNCWFNQGYGDFCVGYSETYKENYITFSECAGMGDRQCTLHEVYVMQYTGLKDKNEKEIYEGDIISLHGAEFGGVVFWHNEGACFYQNHRGSILGICGSDSDYEIIGNQYENPELMENKND